MAEVRLKAGREKSLRHRHPWVYSGAIERVTGVTTPGDIVDVVDSRGNFLGRGYCNTESKIAVRVLAWDDRIIDDAFWSERVHTAIRRRDTLLADGTTTACRLIHAEADFLPGLIVDRYADVIVVQFLTAGVERVRDIVLDALNSAAVPAAVFERSDTASRVREGLTATSGSIRGDVPPTIEILEHGIRFQINVESGQKTGFYLDQRDNRAAVASMAKGKTLLDAYCHTGAFAAHAMRAGACALTLVDSSATSLAVARTNLELNAAGGCEAEFVHDDVPAQLRKLREAGKRFDLVVLDPPRFATNRHQLDNALRAYKDINRVALEVLAPGGILATFSCSQAVDAASFTMAVAWAGLDAGRELQIIRRLGQGSDHPVLASFPESEYLKGLLVRTA
ncbi:MAG TPA: class I SAM-dependent rRNA methyltransferase [Candidatus Krumholzibacteria bacterium]|nr:class I SAM-dependent rRNA methyltransferase [Candidatus Krumholzibacteria bacterium]